MDSMEVSQETVEKVQHFAEDRQKVEEYYEQHRISSSDIQDYERKLDDTLRELQDRVRRQEDDLRRLRAVNATPSIGVEAGSRMAQVRRAKGAYDSLLKSEPDLPKPESPLPSLLAIEETTRILKESKASISMTAEKLVNARQRLKTEETALRDARSIQDGLRRRIDSIRKEQSTNKEKSPSDLARDHLEEQQKKIITLDQDAGRMKTALHKFCEDTLAPMIAAEDLGGPAVGDAADISDATLASGYTRHGKPKKPKSSETEDQSSNQNRIDDLLRRQTGQESTQPSNKREAAAVAIQELLDTLLDAGSSYIDVPQESAASRFLVKAKVAQFHPRDARRLRLIDFGRSLND
ncbi:hypothetical protein P175DRAFT_0553729 [Aspergillus ochraceoroseus IBT 24754]|uniref:Uncharacterized protein n=3 Tax=Aspergillus subgen. Nidulantes TaxID=2720870 RepID=A0A0F8XUX9_9EURO|nr:uncharacterized protein P175DRAFT_0553729 [Aspergillus ochraceoroseus IBT 24754]KKK16173.1 hypothetical protein AOCH_002157 [Aspergillus ochraceoroseus]KKK27277.1 hypothetical protein ARAM_001945 [Aspergillus rambellii]PTU24450.1 hypothetical protein P175DRAFT_0553729 [Aspergillus ochraceoroseus IBT 24754]